LGGKHRCKGGTRSERLGTKSTPLLTMPKSREAEPKRVEVKSS